VALGIDIGTVVGSELTTNRDGDDTVRMLQVEMTNSEDVQSIEQFRAPGDDSAPQVGARVIVLTLAPAYKVAVAMDDEVTPSASDGEKILYSFDSGGAKQAVITLYTTGQVDINGNFTVDL